MEMLNGGFVAQIECGKLYRVGTHFAAWRMLGEPPKDGRTKDTMPSLYGKRPTGGSAAHSTSSATLRGSRRIVLSLAILLPFIAATFALSSTNNVSAQVGPLPVVIDLSPDHGPNVGGNLVGITGDNFNNAYQVSFGAHLADFDVVSDDYILATVPAGVGSVSVYVTTLAGTSSLSQAAIYTYEGSFLPTVTDVDPSGGPLAGGTLVTVTGTGFLTATVVLFGGISVPFTVTSDTSLWTVAPASLTAKTVDIRVTNPAGTSPATVADDYVYSDGPVITNITPDTGPIQGGTTVTIYGTGFTGVVNITIGGTNVIFFEVLSDSVIVLTTPSRPAGTVHIVLHKLTGSSATNELTTFTYAGGKANITSVSPANGPASGGTVVTLTGVNFTNATQVTFGGVAGTNLVVVNDGELRVTTPANASGAVDIIIYNPSGTSLVSSIAKFTYNTTSLTYTLQFRWNLVVWQGTDNLSVTTALSTIAGRVTAIYMWDAVAQQWRGNFPNAGNVPGANDFTTLRKGVAYWLALNSPPPATWVVPQ